jgi:membrane-bound metal-dependent hydrolase YbcI (DUF457 family)
MPSPIGHAVGGLIVALAMARSAGAHQTHQTRPTHRTYLTICAVAACLPDVDFLWGRHSMETHSVGFAVIVGLLALGWWRSTGLAVACALAVGSHVLFDWLGSDDTPPLGVMALWPFTNEFYMANAFIFDAISRRYWLPNFIPHNTLAVLREIAILSPIAAALWWWRRKSAGCGVRSAE